MWHCRAAGDRRDLFWPDHNYSQFGYASSQFGFFEFPFTRPISIGSALPSSCQIGQLFFNTTALAGANVYGCNQPNTWSVVGGYSLPPAGPSSLGGITIPNNSGLIATN